MIGNESAKIKIAIFNPVRKYMPNKHGSSNCGKVAAIVAHSTFLDSGTEFYKILPMYMYM